MIFQKISELKRILAWKVQTFKTKTMTRKFTCQESWRHRKPRHRQLKFKKPDNVNGTEISDVKKVGGRKAGIENPDNEK